jgi:hypothetical protein
MLLNHHILAKIATDEVLSKFKKTEWKCANGLGQNFYRVGTSADFPSPDAAFYDSTNKVTVFFEFKPPSETKRGILTGVGQSIAYLQDSDISYLIAPIMLEDYQIGQYLTDLYVNQITANIPAGLILYENNNPSKMNLAQNVNELKVKVGKNKIPKEERFWAKHVDLPIPLFHLILHYYYLSKTNQIVGDPFAKCWQERMIPSTILEDFKTANIKDMSNKPIMTVAGTKEMTYLEKNILKLKGSFNEKRRELEQMISTQYSGDNYYNSVKKNLISFVRNMHMIDSENRLTESGFKLYHLGLVNGSTSKIFEDYFTKELLTIGHHLDLILDFESLMQKNLSADANQIFTSMEIEYENKGYIKRNPNRMNTDKSKVGFLKYEKILWKALGLIDANYAIQWRKITEICSLPDL